MLNIQKFYRVLGCTLTIFWNTFKIIIHDNDSLTKSENFHYLHSYLSSSDLNAIEGLEISELCYDILHKCLEERFESKDIIIIHHMSKLINLFPFLKYSRISKLKKYHDDIGINV